LIPGALTGLIALFGTFTQLATISVIARFAQYISTCLAALVLCREERKHKPFFWRAVGIAVPLLGLLGMGWLLWQATPGQLYWGFGALLIGVPLYFLQGRKKEVLT